MSEVKLILGDCLDVMRGMESNSIDAIITDLPYGTTACRWDNVIPFEPMWNEIRRILKHKGIFITTSSQPFTSKLIMSNPEWFKYELIWEKSHATGHLDCMNKPMKKHENILIFCGDGRTKYNPQFYLKEQNKIRKGKVIRNNTDCYGNFKNDSPRLIPETESFPTSIIYFPSPYKGGEAGEHPTQKPIALYEYLILTYTNKGDIVLDICAGSGTTGVACVKTDRNFIGVEIDPTYYAIAERRIHEAQMQPNLFECQ